MMEKPENCCAMGSYEHTIPVCIARKKVEQIDFCIAPLVVALEAGGFSTVASCCGHGILPAHVMCEDGSMIVHLTREQGMETIGKYGGNNQQGLNGRSTNRRTRDATNHTK